MTKYFFCSIFVFIYCVTWYFSTPVYVITHPLTISDGHPFFTLHPTVAPLPVPVPPCDGQRECSMLPAYWPMCNFIWY